MTIDLEFKFLKIIYGKETKNRKIFQDLRSARKENNLI